mgnify:CR=1 FL=1
MICIIGFLFIGGLGFLIAGITDVFSDEKFRGFLFIIIGALLFIPGGYYSIDLI